MLKFEVLGGLEGSSLVSFNTQWVKKDVFEV